MPPKRYLMTPGPTPVPPAVLAALSLPIEHHRTRDFRLVLDRLLARLREVHRTEDEVLLFTSSGTGAMESAVANLCSRGDRVLVVSAGNFGERWVGLAEAFGCEVVPLRYEWGESPAPDDVARALEETRDVKAVFFTHSETSTGVVADLEHLAAAVAPSGALVVVDAVSSLGAVPLDVALGLLLEEGLEETFDRHVRLGRACRAGVRAMGLELFSPDDDRSAVVTAIRMPEGVDGAEVVREASARHGITLEGGRGPLVGKIVRIGHIGYVDVFEVIAALTALESVLAALGADVERGVAGSAALAAFGGEPVRV